MSHGVLSSVHHFDGKAEVEEYIRSLNTPATFFLAGAYMSYLSSGSLRELTKGKWGLALPIPDNSPIPLLDAESDTGKFVKAIFKKRNDTLGKRIYGAVAYYTPATMLRGFEEVFHEAGKGASYIELPHDVFKASLASSGASEVFQEEVLQTMRLMPEFGYYGGASLDSSIAVSQSDSCCYIRLVETS